MSVLVIGESCIDVFQYGDCKRLCPEAPVPVFNPTRNIKLLGNAILLTDELNLNSDEITYSLSTK